MKASRNLISWCCGALTGLFVAFAFCPDRLDAQERVRVNEELIFGHAGVEFADVDGDGDLDWISLAGPSGIALRLNDGIGNFLDATAGRIPIGITPVGASPLRLIVRDITGDGFVDIVFPYGATTQPGFGIGLLQNDGNGVFRDVTSTKMPPPAPFVPERFAVVDIDGDSDPDLVLPFRGSSAQLWINLGDGAFVDRTSSMIPGSPVAWNIVPGDIDGDKDIDLLFVGSRGPLRMLLNDGKGHFAPSHNHSFLTTREGIVSANLLDVDCDGDVDAFVLTEYADYLFINDGSGRFKDESYRMPKPVGYGGSLISVPGDFDGNGSLDILVSCFFPFSSYPKHINYLLNDGKGNFTFVGAVIRDPGGLHIVEECSVADMDNDGDDDLFVLSRPTSPLDPIRCRTWRNLHRHLFVPQNPQLGKPLTLELHSLLASSIVLPFLAAEDANIRLPGISGLLRCDPANTVALGAIAVTTPGLVTMTLPIPNHPKLLGFDFTLQALIFDAKQPRPIGFTNPVTKTIKR